MLTDSLVWFDTFARNQGLKNQILDWIRKDQLTGKGVDGNDEIIGLYSFVTELINPEKEHGTPFTLDDTGDFYRSMFIITLADALIIDADFEKMLDQTWWRDQILELTEENLEKLREIYKENVIRYGKRILLTNL